MLLLATKMGKNSTTCVYGKGRGTDGLGKGKEGRREEWEGGTGWGGERKEQRVIERRRVAKSLGPLDFQMATAIKGKTSCIVV